MFSVTEPFSLLAYSLPILCCFCYGLMLLFRRDSRVKRMHGFMMLMSSFCFAASLVFDAMTQQNGLVPILNVWHMGSVLMMTAIINWYFMLLIRPDVKFFPRHFLMLIPFFLSIIGTFLFLRFAPTTPNVYMVKDYMGLLKDYPEAVYRLVLTAVFIIEQAYLYVNVEWQLKKHRARIKNDFSYTNKVNMNWLQIPILLTFFCCSLNLVYAFTASVETRTIYSIFFFVAIVVLCIYGGTHDDIYYIPEPEGSKKAPYKHPKEATLFIPPGQENVRISKLMHKKICEGLMDLLERQEVYTKPDLRLDDLSEMLNTNKTYVSVVINETFQTSFYALINHYRIKKAVTLLEDPNLQIKDAWVQSGFNSQSTFNAMFKKEKGATPSEWMRREK